MALSESSLQDQKPVAVEDSQNRIICIKCGRIFKSSINNGMLHTKELLCGDCNK